MTASLVLIELTQPKLMSIMVDTGIVNKDFQLITTLGIRMVSLALFGVVLGVGGIVCAARSASGFAQELRKALLVKIQQFSLKEMDEFSVSSLITRSISDVNFIQSMVLQSLRMLVRAPMMLISAIVMAYFTNPKMALILFFAMATLSMILLLLLKNGFPLFMITQKALDKINGNLQESLINIRVIKSFVSEDQENDHFEISNKNLMKASQKANGLIALLNPSMMLVLQASTLIVMGMGSGYILVTHQLKIGELLVFINYMVFTLNSMMMLSMTLTMFARSKASFQRIAAVLDHPVLIHDSLQPVVLEHAHGTLSFNHVSFKYGVNSGNYALEDISFDVKENEHVGIIGSTGCGKSSLIHCLVRLIQHQEGSITLDQLPIETIALDSLRKLIALVPQKNVLFSGTLKDNLKWGNTEATDEELWAALKVSCIDEFVKRQPLELDMQVEQGGSNFSGGQKQRLCIARALISKPKILILDDSMSALDSATEAKLKTRLSREMKDITILMIAQKISSIKDFDRVLVMDNGKVVGFDTPAHLLKTNQVYQEIVASQSQRGS